MYKNQYLKMKQNYVNNNIHVYTSRWKPLEFHTLINTNIQIQNFISLKSHKVNTWVYMYNATYNNSWQGLMGEGGKPAR